MNKKDSILKMVWKAKQIPKNFDYRSVSQNYALGSIYYPTSR